MSLPFFPILLYQSSLLILNFIRPAVLITCSSKFSHNCKSKNFYCLPQSSYEFLLAAQQFYRTYCTHLLSTRFCICTYRSNYMQTSLDKILNKVLHTAFLSKTADGIFYFFWFYGSIVLYKLNL